MILIFNILTLIQTKIRIFFVDLIVYKQIINTYHFNELFIIIFYFSE